MKSLGGAAALSNEEGSQDFGTANLDADCDDWQNFESKRAIQPAEDVYQFSMLAGRVMKYCFETGSEYQCSTMCRASRRHICSHHRYYMYEVAFPIILIQHL